MLRTLSGGEPSSNKWIILCAADKSVRYVNSATPFFKEVRAMYQALYRKYRPRVFADVYGQDHITKTLINEVENNHISHAYLFTGSRGTGKTTCAKILSKAVNCQNVVNGEPCNECEICKGIDNGTIFDVVEIDAASNNGVDNIRDLNEEVHYLPNRCKYRVYIIDEVHMLSIGAFNALLKTLEEPPEHVIFILATTEVQKLPATILSRCQRFDFKRIQPEVMTKRLMQVAELEGLELQNEAAVLISRIADGAMRDALSILDQAGARNTVIDEAVVSRVAGIASRESLYKIATFIADKNSAGALQVVSELYQNSYDMERLTVELVNRFRDFLIAKTVSKNRDLIVCTDDEYKTITEMAARFTLPQIVYILDLLQEAYVKIKGGANARIEVELAVIKLCEPKLEASMDSVLDRLASVERAIRRINVNGVSVPRDDGSNEVAVAPYAEEEQGAENATKASDNAYVAKNEPQNSQTFENEPQKTATEPQKNAFNEKSATSPTGQSFEPQSGENAVPQEAGAMPREAGVQSSPQQASPAPQSRPDRVPFDLWDEFIEVLHKRDVALFSVINGSKAYISGDYFLIDPANSSLKQFVKVPTHAKTIRTVLQEVTGKWYKLGILKKPQAETAKRDPLEDLIFKAKGNDGVEIK